MSNQSSRKSGRVTIHDVAADAGVSFAAVSKVIREATGVSDQMRARVQASMARLGYRPHTAARGMRGRTFTLGVIFPDIRNPFFADILSGVYSALKSTQYQASISINQAGSILEEAMIDSLVDRQIDGLLVVGATDQRQLLEIAKRRPVVTIGNHDPEATLYDTVNNDDNAGARLAVTHLVRNGFRRISMISLSGGSSILKEREAGYREAMAAHGLDANTQIVHSRQAPKDLQRAAQRLLGSSERPEAVFCWTDFVAFELISVAGARGFKIPQDLAIVGYDNTMWCDLTQNSLTSIDQSGELLGSRAIKMLIERVKGRQEPKHLVIAPRLSVRASSAERLAIVPSYTSA